MQKLKIKILLPKLMAALLISAMCFIQYVQFTHTSHCPSSNSECSNLNTDEVSCIVCYYLHHTQGQQIHTFNTLTLLKYNPTITTLYFNDSYSTLHFSARIYNNKSPPHLVFHFNSEWKVLITA